MTSFSNTRSEAIFSSCSKFRYWLCREWGVWAPFGIFLLQNPSKADALSLDITTTACTNLALTWGWRGFGIVNVNPEISTNGLAPIDPRDPINDFWIERAHKLADVFVIGTGERYHDVMHEALNRFSRPAGYCCIETNKGDGYLHPRAVTDSAKYPTPKPINGRP